MPRNGRPALITETIEDPLLPDPVPNRLTLTNVVVPICRSRTNTSLVTVGIVGHQIARIAAECHETAVRADRGDTRKAIARPGSKPVDAHQRSRPHLQIPHEHVAGSTVGIVGHQIARCAVNATKRPSALIPEPTPRPLEEPLPDPVPNRLTLTNVVVPSCRSRTNTSSVAPLVSFATKSLAALLNATKRPSALIMGATEMPPLPDPGSKPVDAHQRVVPSCRSRTNTSTVAPLVSFATKSLAALPNATKRPSALITL